MQIQSLGLEDPLEEEMATHSSILGEIHGQSLAGYSPWGRKESDRTEATAARTHTHTRAHTHTHTHTHMCAHTHTKSVFKKFLLIKPVPRTLNLV